MTDDELQMLLPRLREGDRLAFEALVRALSEPLLGYAHGVLDDWASAQDVVQESLLALFRTRRRLRPDTMLRGYCFRIVRNRARNALRDAKLRRIREEEAEMTRVSGFQTAEERSAATDLWAAVGSLPESLREVIELRFRHGLKLQDTAQALEISEGTVSTRQRQALSELRKHAHLASLPALGLADLPRLLEAGAQPLAVPSEMVKTLEGLVMAAVGKKTVSMATVAILLLLTMTGIGGAWWATTYGPFAPPQRPAYEAAPEDDDAVARIGSEDESAGGGSAAGPTGGRGGDDIGAAGRRDSRTGRGGAESGDPREEEDRSGRTTGTETEKSTSGISGDDPAGEETSEKSTIDYGRVTVTISGRILDPNGNPLPHHEVEVINDFLYSSADAEEGEAEPAEPTARRVRVFGQTTSEPDGSYRLTFNLGGYRPELFDDYCPLYVRARSAVYLWGLKCVQVNILTNSFVGPDCVCIYNDVDVRFRQPAQVRLTVVDQQGNAVIGARCWWRRWGQILYLPDGSPAVRETDGFGRVDWQVARFEDDDLNDTARPSQLKLDRGDIFVHAFGYAVGTAPVDVHRAGPEEAVEVLVVLEQGLEVSGRIEDQLGDPVADTRLTVTFMERNGGRSFGVFQGDDRDVSTGSGGEFLFQGVLAGSWTVSIQAEGYVWGRFDLELENSLSGVLFTLARYSEVSFEFFLPGGDTPLKCTEYRAESLDGVCRRSNYVRQSTVRVDRLEAGRTYRITFQFESLAEPYTMEITAPSAASDAGPQRIEIEGLSGVRVSGTLTDSSGNALKGKEIRLQTNQAVEIGGGSLQLVVFKCTTGEDGSFEFLALKPGLLYTLEIRIPGYASKEQGFFVKNTDIGPLQIELHKGGTIEVEMPVPPVGADWVYRLEALNSNGGALGSSEGGEFVTLENLPPGKIVLRLSTNRFIDRRHGDEVTDFVFECEDGGSYSHSFRDVAPASLSVTVLDSDGKPVADAEVTFLRVPPETTKLAKDPKTSFIALVEDSGSPSTDANGSVATDGLLEGRYVIRVNVGKAEPYDQIVDVVAGVNPATIVHLPESG